MCFNSYVCLYVCVCFSVSLSQKVCLLPLLPLLSVAAAHLPATESKALHTTAFVQLPSRGLPPLRTLQLGSLHFRTRLRRPDMVLVLLAVPDQVMQAAALLILQDKLKQTVHDHFAS